MPKATDCKHAPPVADDLVLRLRLEAKPLFVGRMTIVANRATIVTHSSTVHVVAPSKCLRDLFDLVDGTISTASVLDRLSGRWDRRCLLGLINHLFDAGVLVESNKAIAAHWACVQQPAKADLKHYCPLPTK